MNNSIKLESLFTQDNAEKGVWHEIHVPNTTESFKLRIAGADSFAYRAFITQQNASEMAREPLKDDDYNSREEIERRHLVKCNQILSLVTDWDGFDEEFSKEKCLNLIINAAFVLIEIDAFAGKRSNFITPR